MLREEPDLFYYGSWGENECSLYFLVWWKYWVEWFVRSWSLIRLRALPAWNLTRFGLGKGVVLGLHTKEGTSVRVPVTLAQSKESGNCLLEIVEQKGHIFRRRIADSWMTRRVVVCVWSSDLSRICARWRKTEMTGELTSMIRRPSVVIESVELCLKSTVLGLAALFSFRTC